MLDLSKIKSPATLNGLTLISPQGTVSQVSQQQNSSSSSGDGITSESEAAEDVLNGDSGDYETTDGSGTTSSGGATSPLLDGTMTFEELIQEICDGIDIIFVPKRSTIVVTDYETLYAEAKYLRDKHKSSIDSENIKLWQLEEDSYELDVSEYGYYNTVVVKYKNGTVTETYDDLVRVFGKVTAEYEEPTLDKTSAIMKAKAYLAAHVREFEMTINARIIHDGDIDLGDIVTLDNPLTLHDKNKVEVEKVDPEYLFVVGQNISWDGTTPILCDLELQYGAKSPERKDVPETGSSGYSGNGTASNGSNDSIQQAVLEVAKMYHGMHFSHGCSSYSCARSGLSGDCWACSALLSCELQSRGVNTRILQYGTAEASNHRSVQYQDATGQYHDFPYRGPYRFRNEFFNTGGTAHGHEVTMGCG